MEKKTIGKFIAELRHEKGFTQRELAEKLLVSNKTVSRWERDETLPELSLIPALADIFGITSDELLRGERKRNERTRSERTRSERKLPETDTIIIQTEKADTAAPAKETSEPRGEKEFLYMMKTIEVKLLIRCIVTLGLGLLGFVASMICINLPMRNEGIAAIAVALMIDLSAIIYQTVYTIGAFLSLSVEELGANGAAALLKTKLIKRTLWVVSCVVIFFTLTVVWLHLGDIVEFLICGAIFGSIAAVACLIISALIMSHLRSRGIIK